MVVGLGSGCHRMSFVASRHCQCVWLLHETFAYFRLPPLAAQRARGHQRDSNREDVSRYRGDSQEIGPSRLRSAVCSSC